MKFRYIITLLVLVLLTVFVFTPRNVENSEDKNISEEIEIKTNDKMGLTSENSLSSKSPSKTKGSITPQETTVKTFKQKIEVMKKLTNNLFYVTNLIATENMDYIRINKVLDTENIENMHLKDSDIGLKATIDVNESTGAVVELNTKKDNWFNLQMEFFVNDTVMPDPENPYSLEEALNSRNSIGGYRITFPGETKYFHQQRKLLIDKFGQPQKRTDPKVLFDVWMIKSKDDEEKMLRLNFHEDKEENIKEVQLVIEFEYHDHD